MYFSRPDGGPKPRNNLSNNDQQNSHVAALNAAISNPSKPQTPKNSNVQGMRFSRTTNKTQTRSDSDEYVYPDTQKAPSSKVDTLGSINKLQTGQVLISSPYGIYDYADADVPASQYKKKAQNVTTKQNRKTPSKCFSNKTLMIFLCLAVLIIIVLAAILTCVIIFFKPSNSDTETYTPGNFS